VITKSLEIKYPSSSRGVSVTVSPLEESIVGSCRSMLLLLEATIALVLLITCANIASLLLVRTGAREKEFAIRAALGASRTRLFRYLLIESVLLAFFGGALGCLLAIWSKDVIVFFWHHDFPI